MSQSEPIVGTRRGRVGIITFNRPEKRNALDREMHDAFLVAIGAALRDAAVRVIVLTGAGDKSFVAGFDVAELEGLSALDLYRYHAGPTLYDAIEHSPKPVIAAINGYCLGAGLEIALACDIRIASEGARFGHPEVGLGFIPAGGGTQRLPRIVGLGAAMRLLLTGDLIGAEEALRLRLIEEIVPGTALLDRVVSYAERMACKSPIALAAAKEATRAAIGLSLAEGLKLESALAQMCFASEDRIEGVRAFLERRTPAFGAR
jgi:enoyl-CoA hydratase